MTVSEYMVLGIFVLLGVFSLIAAVFDIDWYFKTSGAMMYVRWFGRRGARIFYAVLGLALIGCGVAGFVLWR